MKNAARPKYQKSVKKIRLERITNAGWKSTRRELHWGGNENLLVVVADAYDIAADAQVGPCQGVVKVGNDLLRPNL